MASLFKSRYFSSCNQSLSTASLIVNFSGSFLCKSIRGNSLRLLKTENQFSCLGSNKENKELLLDALEMYWWQPECQIFSCRELTVKMAARPSVILSPLCFLGVSCTGQKIYSLRNCTDNILSAIQLSRFSMKNGHGTLSVPFISNLEQVICGNPSSLDLRMPLAKWKANFCLLFVLCKAILGNSLQLCYIYMTYPKYQFLVLEAMKT